MTERNWNVYLRDRNIPAVVEAHVEPNELAFTGGVWHEDEAWTTHDFAETDMTDADAFAGMTYATFSAQLLPTDPISTITYGIPTRFQAIHLNLIPKGTNRGKVMAWNSPCVVATLAGSWRSGEQWTLQPWCIFDPAETPAGARFENYLLPLAPREKIDIAVTPNVGANTFTTGPPHGYVDTDYVMVYSSTGNYPTPFVPNQPYIVTQLSPTTFRLKDTAGTTIALTGVGGGVISIGKHYLHTLFCAGQAWDPNGNLVVAGGSRFEISSFGDHNTYPHTWLWDPSESADIVYTAGGPNGTAYPYAMERVDLGKAIGTNHYEEGFGRWIQGPDLDVPRYYPTVAMTAPMAAGRSTHADLTCALVLGGDDEPEGVEPLAQIGGTYESLVVDAEPTYTGFGATSDSGLVKESVGGVVFSWDGPSDWDAVTNPFPDGNPFRDGLYFYPHMHLLTSGKMFMASFTHESATLNHDLAPGTWTTTEGHTDQSGLTNAFRYYPSSVHWIDDDGADIVLRMGGGTIPAAAVPDVPVFLRASQSGNTLTGNTHNFQTGAPVMVTNAANDPPAPLVVGTTYFVIRISATQLQLATSSALATAGTPIALLDAGTGDTRVYADVTTSTGILYYGAVLGGYRPIDWPGSPLDTRSVDRITPSTAAAQWTVGPSLERPRTLMNVAWLADGSLLAIGGVNVDDSLYGDVAPAIHPLLDHVHGEAIVDEGHVDHVTVSGQIGGFLFHLTPEIMRWGGSRWEPLDWATSTSYRDYHSTAVLLPDGRVLVAGGENRQVDWEIFTPPYLAPSSDHHDLVPERPTGVALSGPAPVDDTYERLYATTYTLTCDALADGVRLERVTLVSPGSATHHNNWSQQFANLTVVQGATPNSVSITMPASNKHFRPGYAMLFAIDSVGVPSEAIWIKLPQP